MSTIWEHAAARKRDSIFNLIPQEWRISKPPSNKEQRDVTGSYIHQFLSPEEVEITETDAATIGAKISSQFWTATAVTKAFCHRAALAHQLTNCLLEIFFDQAIARAQELDAHITTGNGPLGPLHGIPISLKDQFHVTGVETTMGYVGWINTFQGEKGTGLEKKFQSEMVKELLALGAVLYCKTSVPHTLMSGETINNIVGYAWNPKNRNLTPGGSSGGEGALIGLRGSPLGFGTDIGGSIRIPAAFNGLFGLRPSAGRLPYEGMANSMDGQNTILSVVGPLAPSVSALELVVKALLSQEPWLHDPMVVDLPWRPHAQSLLMSKIGPGKRGKLSFGVMLNDGSVQPHPPVRRAIEMVVKSLKAAGHEILEWRGPSHADLVKLALAAWTADGGADIQKDFALSGEPVSSQVAGLIGGEKVEEKTASAIAEINRAKRAAQKEYLEYWNGTKDLTSTGEPVECIICPVAPFCAARPGCFRYVGYTTFVNVLDYTAITVPVTTVDKSLDQVDVNFKPQNDEDKNTQADYDPEVYDGAHVSIQLVGRRFQEEKMLLLADYVSKILATA